MSGEKITTKSTLEVMQLLDECRRQMGLVYPMERAMQAGGDVKLNGKIKAKEAKEAGQPDGR